MQMVSGALGSLGFGALGLGFRALGGQGSGFSQNFSKRNGRAKNFSAMPLQRAGCLRGEAQVK